MDTYAEITLPDGATTTLHVAPASPVAADDLTEAPLALMLPAMGVPAGYYGPFLEELAAHGVTAAVADYPGQGESRPRIDRGHDYGYENLAHVWLPAVVKRLREVHDGPLVIVGHSLGGHVLLANLAGEDPLPVAGVVIGAATPHWPTHDGVKTLVQTQFLGLVARLLGYWPGTRLGFGGQQPRTLIREWAAFSRTGVLAPDGRSIGPGLRGRELPLLVIDLDNDPLAPRRSVEAFAALAPDARVERWSFTKGPQDPGKPVDHYSFARSPEIIGERVATWCREATAGVTPGQSPSA